jgi:hypothetical protein
MTKIYIYCLFDRFDRFLGVYSSLKSIHRDAVKYCNTGSSSVFLCAENEVHKASLVTLRNLFKGKCDYEIQYRSDSRGVKILKTKLTE